VSNHSGGVRPTRDDRPRRSGGAPRPRRCTSRRALLQGLSGFSMLLPKIGGVAAHPANVQRLLYRRAPARPRLPEGRKGTEKLYKDAIACALRAAAAFVEAAMRGAPRSCRSPSSGRGGDAAFRAAQAAATPHRAHLLPDHAHVAALRAARMVGYLRLSSRSASCPPVRTDDYGREPWEDKALVQTVAHDVRATIQEELYEGRQAPERVVG